MTEETQQKLKEIVENEELVNDIHTNGERLSLLYKLIDFVDDVERNALTAERERLASEIKKRKELLIGPYGISTTNQYVQGRVSQLEDTLNLINPPSN